MQAAAEADDEFSFELPMASRERFPELFGELERNSQELGVKSFGVGMTTLEEVFLRLASVSVSRCPPPFSSMRLNQLAVLLSC